MHLIQMQVEMPEHLNANAAFANALKYIQAQTWYVLNSSDSILT